MKVGGLLARRRIGLLAAIVMPLALSGLSACSSAPKNDTFDLSASPAVETTASARNRQLLIADPSALKAVDSEQVLVRVSGSEIRYLSNAQWSDKLSRMVQSKLVEAFENTGKLGGVGKPGQGLAIDYQLITDIRAFEIDASGSDRAVVEISAKLLNDRNGTVKAQRAFSASLPTGGSTNEVYVRAMDRAFGQVTAEIVAWTMTQL